MFFMLDILATNPIIFLMLILSLVVCITIHEFAHAYVAYKLGDPTAKYLGRVTLDPRSHVDLYGMLFLIIAGFGWGRPVPYNEINLRNPKKDAALIAFAGPMSNFTLAMIVGLIINFIDLGTIINTFLVYLAYYNIILGVFNLLPFHPLDGFKIVTGVLPYSLAYQWKQTENYGIFILLFLVFTDNISRLVFPAVGFLSAFIGLPL